MLVPIPRRVLVPGADDAGEHVQDVTEGGARCRAEADAGARGASPLEPSLMRRRNGVAAAPKGILPVPMPRAGAGAMHGGMAAAGAGGDGRGKGAGTRSTASAAKPATKGKHVKHAHVHVHLGQQCKGGSEQRVNRVGKFEAAILDIEAQGGVEIHRVSEASMHKRKMALNIDRIVLLQGSCFYEKMNDALKLPSDKKLDKKKLCSGVRETMRYLGMLPGAKGHDGRLDWGCAEFVFDDEAREERLARAIQTHKKGEAPAGGHAEAGPEQDKSTGAASKALPKVMPKGALAKRSLGSLEVQAQRRHGKDKAASCKASKASQRRQRKPDGLVFRENENRFRSDVGQAPAHLDTSKRAGTAACRHNQGPSSRCVGLVWVKKGTTRGGVKYREHLNSATGEEEACKGQETCNGDARTAVLALAEDESWPDLGPGSPAQEAGSAKQMALETTPAAIDKGAVTRGHTCPDAKFTGQGSYDTPGTHVKRRCAEDAQQTVLAKKLKADNAAAAAGLLMLAQH